MDAVLVKNADRMMTLARQLGDGIEVQFADGRSGLMPFVDIPEIRERAVLSRVELPNPYEIILETVSGEQVEIPWDFARHYCDESYRPAVQAIAMHGRQTLGRRVRWFRVSAGLTQEDLARTSHIGRVTLIRIERGAQSPRYATLTAIARALGKTVTELLLDPESTELDVELISPPTI